MSDQQNNQDAAQLQHVSAELTSSLERCRELIDDCRAKLATNLNNPEEANSNEPDEVWGEHASQFA